MAVRSGAVPVRGVWCVVGTGDWGVLLRSPLLSPTNECNGTNHKDVRSLLEQHWTTGKQTEKNIILFYIIVDCIGC